MQGIIPPGSGKPRAPWSPRVPTDGAVYESGTMSFDKDLNVIHLGSPGSAGSIPAAQRIHFLLCCVSSLSWLAVTGWRMGLMAAGTTDRQPTALTQLRVRPTGLRSSGRISLRYYPIHTG
jgi:hypothetical protein